MKLVFQNPIVCIFIDSISFVNLLLLLMITAQNFFLLIPDFLNDENTKWT